MYFSYDHNFVSTIQFLLALLEENIFDPTQDVLICNSQPQNNEVAEQKQQKRQVNWRHVEPQSQPTRRIGGKSPLLLPSASFHQLPLQVCFIIFHSFKSSNIPRAKECEIPWRFSNGILG